MLGMFLTMENGERQMNMRRAYNWLRLIPSEAKGLDRTNSIPDYGISLPNHHNLMQKRAYT